MTKLQQTPSNQPKKSAIKRSYQNIHSLTSCILTNKHDKNHKNEVTSTSDLPLAFSWAHSPRTLHYRTPHRT